MKIGIISRGIQNYTTLRLVESAKRADHSTQILDPFGFDLAVTPKKPIILYEGNPAHDFDFIIPRFSETTAEFGLEVLTHFESIGTPTLNGSDAIRNARHKFRSLRILAENGIPILPSFTTGSADFLPNALDAIESKLPIVAKPFEGTHGKGIMLIDSLQSLRSIISAMCDFHHDYVVQIFINNREKSDLRLIVVGGRVVAWMKRIATNGDFRSNIHLSGIGRRAPMTDDLKELAIRCTSALDLQIAGVDLIPTDDGYAVLEVNPSPGFEEIEAVTGIDVAKEIIAHGEKFAKSAL